MSSTKECQRREEANVAFRNSIEQVREHFAAANILFGELKLTSKFLVDLAEKFDLSNDQIEALKEKIDNLFLTLNESMLMTSGRIINELEHNSDAIRTSYMNKSQQNNTADVSLNLFQSMPYEELYAKYNDALNKNVELIASITDLSHRFNALQEKCRTDQEKFGEHADKFNAEQREIEEQKEKYNVEQEKLEEQKERCTLLEDRVQDLQKEKRFLEQKLHDAQALIAEHTKENHESFETTRTLMLNSTLTQVQMIGEDFLERAKTADDFIETFEKVFKGADEIVQLVKHLDKTESAVHNGYIIRALEKSRMMRQVIHDVLAVFRKARINPSILGGDVGAQVAEELKRIYETLKFVKTNTEKRPVGAQKS